VVVSTENYKLFISTKGRGKKMAKRLTEKEEPEISKIN
jgi:Holliday junction resolvasome RuvABC DNA-binding subunit